MPKLDIDMFDKAPKVGDKVKVVGKVKFIDEDSGEVEVSYDDVSIIGKKKSSDGEETETVSMDMEETPNTNTMDYALSQAFNRTQ